MPRFVFPSNPNVAPIFDCSKMTGNNTYTLNDRGEMVLLTPSFLVGGEPYMTPLEEEEGAVPEHAAPTPMEPRRSGPSLCDTYASRPVLVRAEPTLSPPRVDPHEPLETLFEQEPPAWPTPKPKVIIRSDRGTELDESDIERNLLAIGFEYRFHHTNNFPSFEELVEQSRGLADMETDKPHRAVHVRGQTVHTH